jgi:hypothetical protein
MGGSGPLRASGLEPPPRVASREEGVEEPLAGLMGAHALPEIVESGEVNARVCEFQAEGIRPMHAAADGIGCLTVGQPCDLLHPHD